ncbi:MAG: hypothetical protein K6F35_05925 [Lachnospiraceae bacterium]|nr:hypothetical protein [Lachnospiraceae bacterium]
MEDKKILKDDQMAEVAGGKEYGMPVQHFFVGDKVLLRIYPEYGVGTIREMRVVEGSGRSYWECVVQFDAGMMTADQDEFISAG